MDGCSEPTPREAFSHEAMVDRFQGIVLDQGWVAGTHFRDTGAKWND
jgi:hypothetical protein